MFQISQVIYNLQRYGNCKVYFYEPTFGNQNVNTVIEFKINKYGELEVISKMEIFSDKPRWDGKNVNCVNPVEVVTVLDEDRLKLNTRIAAIIASELYGNKTFVTANEKLDVFTAPQEPIDEIYTIANNMISNWSSKEYSNITIGGLDSLMTLLLAKENQSIEDTDYCSDYAAAIIEGKMAKFLSRARTVHHIWEKLNSLVLDKDQVEALRLWQEITRNDTPDINKSR